MILMAKKVSQVNSQVATREMTIESPMDKNRVRVSFVSEAPCFNWGIPEYMVCTKEAADLSRAEKGIAPVLFNHDRDKVVGRMENITIENGKGYADVVFDEDEESQKIADKVRSGSIKGVSIGYIRNEVKHIYEGETYEGKFPGECDVVTKWSMMEFSIVTIPADPEVGVGVRQENQIQSEQPTIQTKGEEKMAEEKKAPVITKEQVEEAARAAREAETQRVKDIASICRQHNIESADMDKFISDGTDINGVRAAVLDILSKREKPMTVKVTKDVDEKVRERAALGLEAKYGVAKTEDREALKYGNLSLKELASVVMDGELNDRERGAIRFETPTEIYHRAMGSATFLGVIDDFSHKTLAKAYSEVPVVFPALVSKGSNVDFKPNYQYQLGLDGEPVEMSSESGEFTYTDVKDQRVSTSIKTYGKGIRLTREIFINDALGQVQKAISMQSAGFRRLQEKQYFAMLTNAKNYSKANGNLATTAGVSTDAFSEMIRLMKNQKSFDKRAYIGVAPQYVVAPTALEAKIAQFLRSTSDPAATNSGVANIYNGALTLITSPYLDEVDEASYYMLANPNAIWGIEFTTLNGKDTPTSRTVVPNEHLGIEIQLYMDYGFNLLGVQGMVKNPGK